MNIHVLTFNRTFYRSCLCEKNVNVNTTQVILENGVYISRKEISSSLSDLLLGTVQCVKER